MNIDHQGDTLFVTWYTYAPDGRPTWFVGSQVRRTGNGTYAGTLYRSFGPPFNASPWNTAGVSVMPAGTIALSFSDADNGRADFAVEGISRSNAITRQVFASPPTVCR
jgi:hypothetical protein